GVIIAYIGKSGETLPSAEGPGAAETAHSAATSSADGQQHSAPVVEISGAVAEVAPGGRALATPVARQLAREHGIDIQRVRGSGPDGRVERKDVQALMDGGNGAALMPVAPPDQPVPRHRQ